MPVYVWVAETKRGRKLKGEIDAANETIALNQLKKRNFKVRRLKPKPKDLLAGISFLKPKVECDLPCKTPAWHRRELTPSEFVKALEPATSISANV